MMEKKVKYQKEIKKIVKRIAGKYKPEKIILFGSFAYGKPGKNSDADLFIIKKTKKPRTKRHFEVDKLLMDRSIPLDILVYTPEEVKRRLFLEDFFIRNIIRQGKPLYVKK